MKKYIIAWVMILITITTFSQKRPDLKFIFKEHQYIRTMYSFYMVDSCQQELALGITWDTARVARPIIKGDTIKVIEKVIELQREQLDKYRNLIKKVIEYLNTVPDPDKNQESREWQNLWELLEKEGYYKIEIVKDHSLCVSNGVR